MVAVGWLLKGKVVMFKVAMIGCVGLLIAGVAPSAAQQVGDRIRVGAGEGEGWVIGRLVDLSPSGTLVLSPSLGEPSVQFELHDIDRADWYKERNLAGQLLLGIVGGAGPQIIFPCKPAEGSCITSSRDGDVALWAGIGLAAALLVHLIKPGDWKTWISEGQITVR